jgi:hypothetical protein
VKIYVATVQALRKKETQDETQLITKIGEKTSLGLSYFRFIPSYAFDALSCPNWPFSPSNRLTLWITHGSIVMAETTKLYLSHMCHELFVRGFTLSCSELDLIQELEMSNMFEPSQIHDLKWVEHGSCSQGGTFRKWVQVARS